MDGERASRGPCRRASAGCDLRHARYRGLAKTRLQHVLTASALNVVRAVRWMEGEPLAQTRTSPLVALAA